MDEETPPYFSLFPLFGGEGHSHFLLALVVWLLEGVTRAGLTSAEGVTLCTMSTNEDRRSK